MTTETKQKVKAESGSKSINKIKKQKINNFFKITFLFSAITITSLTGFYQIALKDYVQSADATIQKNKDYVASFSASKNNTSLFSDNYTDEDFAQDLKLFSMLSDPSTANSTYNKNFKEITVKKNMLIRMRDIMMVSNLTGYSYEKVYDLKFKPYNTLESLGEKEKKDVELKLQENKKMLSNITHSRENIMTLANFGVPVSFYKESYNNLSYLFKKEYGSESYIDSFMFNLNGEHEEQSKYDNQITNKIFTAFNNKDYETLRLFFKQNREFIQYFNGLDVGKSPLSVNNMKNWNSEQKYAFYYMAWRQLTNGFIHFKSPEKSAYEFIEDNVYLF